MVWWVPEGSKSTTMSQYVSMSVTKVGIELLGQLKTKRLGLRCRAPSACYQGYLVIYGLVAIFGPDCRFINVYPFELLNWSQTSQYLVCPLMMDCCPT